MTDSKPIQVGDLVVIVGTRKCGCMGSIGFIRTVSEIQNRSSWCRFCGHQDEPAPSAYLTDGWAQIFRLKRIPPLEELEGQRTQEDIKEPAQ